MKLSQKKTTEQNNLKPISYAAIIFLFLIMLATTAQSDCIDDYNNNLREQKKINHEVASPSRLKSISLSEIESLYTPLNNTWRNLSRKCSGEVAKRSKENLDSNLEYLETMKEVRERRAIEKREIRTATLKFVFVEGLENLAQRKKLASIIQENTLEEKQITDEYKSDLEKWMESFRNADPKFFNIFFDDGQTPLIKSMALGELKVLQFLVTNGANVDKKDKDGNTAIMFSKSPMAAEFLLQKSANIEAENKIGETALIIAAKNGNQELVNLLLRKGAEVNHADKRLRTPLDYASYEGHIEIVNILLKNGALVDGSPDCKRTPLFKSLLRGHHEVATQLIQKGADPNKISPLGSSPLMVAIERNFKKITRALIKSGANINHKILSGETALTYAIKKGHNDMATLLLENHADPNVRDENGWTPLMTVASRGHNDLMETLISSGAQVNLQKNDGMTALMIAAAKGKTDSSSILIQKGAKVEEKDKNGLTALVHATQNFQPKTVRFLLDKGARKYPIIENQENLYQYQCMLPITLNNPADGETWCKKTVNLYLEKIQVQIEDSAKASSFGMASYYSLLAKNVKRARDYSDKSISLDPQSTVWTNANLGHSFIILGHRDQAIKAYEKFLELDSSYAQYLKNDFNIMRVVYPDKKYLFDEVESELF
jgi:ankyrin repeat protein